MQKARYLFALSCACASTACGTEVARAVYSAPPDVGVPVVPEKPPQCQSSKLVDRLSHGSITLSEPIRYKRTGYFFGLPQDDRIAFSMTARNLGFVAWVNSAGTSVHVTPLAVGTEFSRFGTDFIVEGTEVSGLVARDNGFALLTRRPDRGDPLGDGMTQAQATYWVRWKNGTELFDVPLTGTKSIVNAPPNLKRDFPNGLSGRLAFNETHYGAYFGVRGGQGDEYFGHNGDKFVQLDESGQFVSSWRMGCRQNLGTRLITEASGFVSFCMSDGTIGSPGVHLVEGAWDARRLAPEVAPAGGGGYTGGNFGSAVKAGDGYLVTWASRGVNANDGSYAYNSHEPAVALLDTDRNPVARFWPFLPRNTAPTADAVNVHAAPYGDNVLIVWETIESPTLRSGGYSTGDYGGTHFRLVDTQGRNPSEEEIVPRAIAPNGQDDIVLFANGDLGWAYVPEERDFQAALPATALPNLPAVNAINFIRLQYCLP